MNDEQHRPILTIGYGTRTFAEFLTLLRRYDVRYLGDVRSVPYSRFSPDFSKETLASELQDAGIRYVYLGDLLGGNPDDAEAHVADRTGERHYVDYAKAMELPDYRAGIARVRTAWERNVGLALMCSEAKPEVCHRVRLIGESLTSFVDVMHIDEQGELRSQNEVMLRINRGQTMIPGFGLSPRASKSSKAFG